jgi:hypothetical protein
MWSGAYRYPGDAEPETVFTAWIEEVSGAFTGRTEEPNVLRLGPESVVTADIDGARSGADVRFSKFMDGSGGMRHVILYAGVVDEALTHISGVWTVPGEWSGSFFMARDATEEDVSVERAIEVD